MPSSDIELIWESDAAIAVNKPAGLSTQTPQHVESLETRLSRQLDRNDKYMAFPHRLDRVVSGVILVALTKKAARLLSAQFAGRKTRKEYAALLEGCVDLESERALSRVSEGGEVLWENYIRKVEGQSLAEACEANAENAKLAATILKSSQFDSRKNQTRVDLLPITGRMHQLRLQTALRGHPIVGDTLYGATNERTQALAEGSETGAHLRIMLHAQRLGFHDPTTGRWTEVEAECPF